MTQVIINADDFGINEVVTSEIERMITLRAITSTTIMANGQCLDEVKRIALLHPEISYGIHLCLSEFKSITKSHVLELYGLIDENGYFIHKQIFKIKKCDDILKNAIKSELNAQIDVIEALDIPISHADSHHHVHTIYPLKEVFSEVLNKREINKIRLGCDFRNLRSKMHICQWIHRNKLNNFYRNAFCTTDVFYSFAEFLNAGCPINEGEAIELMCHPGHHGLSYKEEMTLVENKIILNNSEIKLISYNDLY